ncbi:MAG: S-layer homology domain-containing protein [Eubacteriales bacterium]|nr:S-layer homology domain-containing protein [Eubacteriales bacterium]MDY4214051.1 S-layer homology domain-containing protein [Eubacteriales bacterium]
MRSFKKISAIILVVAMLFSLVSVSVFADGTVYKGYIQFRKAETDAITNTITGTKAGKTVYADVYSTPGSYNALAINFTPTTAINALTVENVKLTEGIPACAASMVNAKTGGLQFKWSSAVTMPEGKPFATVAITIADATTAANDVEIFTDGGYTYTLAGGKPTKVTNDVAKLNILDSFTATSAKAVKDGVDVTAVEVGLGTTAEDAVKGITATVTDGTNSEAGYAVSNWVSTPAFDAAKTGEYEFKGDVVINGEGAANAGTLNVTVTVKVVPITDGTVAEAKGTVMENAENGITEDAIKAALPAELEVVKGDFKDTFTVAWNTVEGYANEGKDYRANDVITVKGTLTSPSKNGLFTTATTDVDGKVTVVPAEIKGGSISINNPIDNGYVTANITVPASEIAKMPLDAEGDSDEVKAEKKAKRTISLIVPNADSTKEGATVSVEVTAEQIAAANEADAKDLNVTLKSDKKMKELGYSSSGTKNFTVNVTVGGTTLLNGDSKDAVSGEVKKATSSSAGGINKGGSTTTTYAVTVVETKNGTATVSPEKAASGATVTVKAEPAEGYKVKSVTAVKADGTNVPVDEKALTFTMPASAVKVTVEFEEGKDEPSVDPTPAEDKFADVADDFWAAKDIYTLKDAGIIGGKSATEFDPEGDVTRAEFAKMVVGLFGYKATSDAVNFEDCKAEDWFTPYVAAGVEAGVIKGVSDTEFAPNATITREDACTILGRALNKVAQSNELKFTDADKVAEYAAPYVALLSELGYVNGYEDGSFAPANNITRAEAAKIIAGIYNAKNTTVTEDKTDAADTTDANVEGENTTAPVEENAEDKADTTDTIDVEPEK